jgi:type IV pilus assembly protein PilA
VSEFFLSKGYMPANNTSAGLAPAGSITGKNVASVQVAAGVVTVTFSNEPKIASQTMIFTPTTGTGSIQWACNTGTVAGKYRPANCR